MALNRNNCLGALLLNEVHRSRPIVFLIDYKVDSVHASLNILARLAIVELFGNCQTAPVKCPYRKLFT